MGRQDEIHSLSSEPTYAPQLVPSDLGDPLQRELRSSIVTRITRQAFFDSERDRINKRRREQRAHERPFF
jgi:hypothetical protein